MFGRNFPKIFKALQTKSQNDIRFKLTMLERHIKWGQLPMDRYLFSILRRRNNYRNINRFLVNVYEDQDIKHSHLHLRYFFRYKKSKMAGPSLFIIRDMNRCFYCHKPQIISLGVHVPLMHSTLQCELCGLDFISLHRLGLHRYRCT